MICHEHRTNDARRNDEPCVYCQRNTLLLQNDELGKQLSVQLGQIQALELKLERVRADFKELEDDANAKEKESNRLNGEWRPLLAESLSVVLAMCSQPKNQKWFDHFSGQWQDPAGMWALKDKLEAALKEQQTERPKCDCAGPLDGLHADDCPIEKAAKKRKCECGKAFSLNGTCANCGGVI